MSRYATQWAAQFYTAAELTRRGYMIAFTLGNAPETDLLVATPNQNHFRVDVKGHSKRNFWDIREREPKKDLYYILVDIFEKPPKYYILTSKEMQIECKKYFDKMKKKRAEQGREFKSARYKGIEAKTAEKYEGRWDILPK